MALRVPGHIKLNGANITVQYGRGDWRWLHQDWVNNGFTQVWETWIKPQIDYAIGNLGCNCIRLISGQSGIFNSLYSQAQHDALWIQLAEYIAERKCYLYPALGQGNWFVSGGQCYGVTATQVATSIAATLTALADYHNIIGVDALQEAGSWESNTAGFVNDVYNGIKAVHPTMPVSFSAYKNLSTYAAMQTWFASINHDYLDFHFYPSNYPSLTAPIVAADLNYWRQTYPTNDIIFGEAGIPNSYSDSEKASFLKAIYRIANEDGRVRGILGWAANDQDVVSTNQWGVYNTSWVERPAKAQIMRAYSRGACVSRLA